MDANILLGIIECDNCKKRNRVKMYDPLARRAKCGYCGYHLDDRFRLDFERKFRKVYDEIEYIEIELETKEKFWGFIWHKYTIEELKQSEHHRKIEAFAGTIESVIQGWLEKGRLSVIEREIYERHREEIDKRLKTVNIKILRREKTKIDKVKRVLQEFAKKIFDSLTLVIGKKLLVLGGVEQKSLPKP